MDNLSFKQKLLSFSAASALYSALFLPPALLYVISLIDGGRFYIFNSGIFTALSPALPAWYFAAYGIICVFFLFSLIADRKSPTAVICFILSLLGLLSLILRAVLYGNAFFSSFPPTDTAAFAAFTVMFLDSANRRDTVFKYVAAAAAAVMLIFLAIGGGTPLASVTPYSLTMSLYSMIAPSVLLVFYSIRRDA